MTLHHKNLYGDIIKVHAVFIFELSLSEECIVSYDRTMDECKGFGRK